MQGTPARRSGTGSAVRMLRGLAPVGQGGAQPGRAVIQIQIAVRGVAVHTQALIRGSLNRTIPASGHATLDARRVTIQVRRRSGRAECLGSGHHGEGAAKKHRPAGKPGAGNLNKRDRHKTIQSENKTRPCYAVAAGWKRQQRAAGSSSTTAKVKRPAARPSRGALKRTPAQVHTHTQTYADIRRPMQMRPDPADSSRSVHANPLRSMNARPQRQALALAPGPRPKPICNNAGLSLCAMVSKPHNCDTSSRRPSAFFTLPSRLINWGCGLPSPRQADLIGPGAASVSGPVQFINSLFSTRHFAGIRAVLTGPVLAAPSAPARQRTPDTSPDHLTCTPPTHP